jgi:uncharacterized protein YcbK (DUF882 family)
VKCPCCGKFVGNEGFYAKLDAAQDRLGFPMEVTSGYRCAAHNAAVSKKSTGRHVQGEAVDVLTRTAGERGAIIKACLEEDIISFAITPHGRALHIDNGSAYWLGLE